MAGGWHQAGLLWHHCCQAHARRCCHVVLVCCWVHNDALASCRVAACIPHELPCSCHTCGLMWSRLGGALDAKHLHATGCWLRRL